MKRFNFRLDKVHNVAHSRAEQASLEFAMAQAEVYEAEVELQKTLLTKGKAQQEFVANLKQGTKVYEVLQNTYYLEHLEMLESEKTRDYEEKQHAAEDRLIEFLSLRKEAKGWSSLRNTAKDRHFKAEGRKEQTMLDDLVILRRT